MTISHKPRGLTDDERIYWVSASAELCDWWRASKLPKRRFVAENRAGVNKVIRNIMEARKLQMNNGGRVTWKQFLEPTLSELRDLRCIRAIESSFGKRVRVEYETINLGNGSEEEQERGELIGKFTGDSDGTGRTIRYHFDDEGFDGEFGERYYLFIDEILSVEELEQ